MVAKSEDFRAAGAPRTQMVPPVRDRRTLLISALKGTSEIKQTNEFPAGWLNISIFEIQLIGSMHYPLLRQRAKHSERVSHRFGAGKVTGGGGGEAAAAAPSQLDGGDVVLVQFCWPLSTSRPN